MDLNKKGELSMVTILVTFASLIILVALLPAVSNLIDDIAPQLANNLMALFLLELIPLFLVITLIMRVFRTPTQNY